MFAYVNFWLFILSRYFIKRGNDIFCVELVNIECWKKWFNYHTNLVEYIRVWRKYKLSNGKQKKDLKKCCWMKIKLLITDSCVSHHLTVSLVFAGCFFNACFIYLFSSLRFFVSLFLQTKLVKITIDNTAVCWQWLTDANAKETKGGCCCQRHI